MFKKLKDKLAEEVKSSPQRIQQFAQAAQAAVTSASSSITDITNNDLFTIGDNESNQQSKKATGTLTPSSNAFQDVSLHSSTQSDHIDFHPSNFPPEHSRQRKLSNSSFASDVSFKLPSYESTSMYHLQSDMDVSASEAEERGLASPGVTLERVTKEQLYAAYRRTQERYSKYRTQYADLARHYKLLERDNAKARSVLVETQDKALRRISELREQCSLEQSAKAHLERALRVEIEEKNMKIDTLNTQIKCLQDNSGTGAIDTSPNESLRTAPEEKVEQLIDISGDTKTAPETNTEIINLNSKIEKLEQLMNKYKESHKLMKEKNSQLTTELQVLHKETDKIKEENNEYQKNKKDLEVACEQIKNENEDLQNKLNQYDFSKTKETSALELDLEKAKEEITQLQNKVDIFSKREEENAISLAENKLSIHKELESKESEIRSLKSSLENQEKNVQKLTKLSNDYKAKISNLEQEILQHTSSISELQLNKHETSDKEAQLQDLKSKCHVLEQLKSKAEEECRCLQLQNKQEIAEKLAMIDRNSYLEERNKQLTEENARKVTQLSSLEKDLENRDKSDSWKDKYLSLEAEMHEERVELAKLQTEIEKLLKNDELVQNENSELHKKILELQSTKEVLQNKMKNIYNNVNIKIKDIKTSYDAIVKEMRKTESSNKLFFSNMDDEIKCLLSSLHHESEFEVVKTTLKELETSKSILETLYNELKEKNELLLVENDNLKTNIRELTSTYENSDTEKYAALNAELLEIKTQYENKLKEISLLQDENSKIRAQIEGTEGRDKKMKKDFSELTGKHEDLQSEYNNLKIELDNNIEINKKLKLTNDKVQNDFDLAKSDYESSLSQLKSLKEDNVSLKNSLQIAEQQCEDLKSKCNNLTTDNKELKIQFETIVSNVGTLENELTDIRKSHEDIEKEKDHLNSIIEQLEQNRESKQYQDAESQYTDDLEKNLKEKIESLSEENNVLKAKCEQTKQEKENLYEKLIVIENKCTDHEQNLIEQSRLVTENDQLTQELFEKTNELSKMNNDVQRLNSTISDLKLKTEKFESVSSTSNEITEKYEVLKQEYDILKEDNRRLLSDIEGLQTYLTKISKENSALNDKLRESIASSETNVDRSSGDMTEELEILKSELLIEKSRVEDLLRQNNMLSEENFELKDQIQSHSYVKPLEMNKDNAHNAERTTIQNKYDAIVKKNSELDRKINDLEILNQSNNVNVEQLQESNKKLRLSNEKLERRLDEALVSLRHLHSLQENTELEYLRNILYEYLTGPGTHSLTLAKVLAAVVKFDDKQTNFILQKEKERQGLLRQLGLT